MANPSTSRKCAVTRSEDEVVVRCWGGNPNIVLRERPSFHPRVVVQPSVLTGDLEIAAKNASVIFRPANCSPVQSNYATTTDNPSVLSSTPKQNDLADCDWHADYRHGCIICSASPPPAQFQDARGREGAYREACGSLATDPVPKS